MYILTPNHLILWSTLEYILHTRVHANSKLPDHVVTLYILRMCKLHVYFDHVGLLSALYIPLLVSPSVVCRVMT